MARARHRRWRVVADPTTLAASPAIKLACQRGITVVVYDRFLKPNTPVTATIYADEVQDGYVAGQAVGQRLFLVIDGARAGALDLDELMAGLTIAPDLAGAFTGDSKLLAQWVRAEVTLAERRAGAIPRGQGSIAWFSAVVRPCTDPWPSRMRKSQPIAFAASCAPSPAPCGPPLR